MVTVSDGAGTGDFGDEQGGLDGEVIIAAVIVAVIAAVVIVVWWTSPE